MSRITIAQLEAFYWIAELGSVERAANRLSLAQPTVSLRLKALEAQLGTELFDRGRRALELTHDGRDLTAEVRSVLQGIERIALRARVREIAGPIRIGFAEGFAVICLAEILDRIHEAYPKLQPELLVATSAEVEEQLHKHRLDLAVLVSPTPAPEFELLPLGMQKAGWIASTRWGLPRKVRPEDLVSLPIIANPPGSINYRQTITWFGSCGLTPKRLDICNSVAVLAHVVRSGAAIGILPAKMVADDAAQGRVQRLESVPAVPDTPICAKLPRGPASPATEAVLASIRATVEGMEYLGPMPEATGAS
ncbi:LysR family transcriptional regulator [Mangrovicella endophytica]|uniref:LysR family transcriptional regulator n=1 Tax=Mangrovicella endophytica TaxID=2066697 RepID=UPI000C9DABAC|nr:LysR family transcriptional regulator [Mangrovicella endophytica]